uniref:Integrase catalytic domain-containing protein n=1 Tax=Meloidogyne enterolobii TaxID=390850 RepID=A0A6V7TI90_MELEN|nr:unnamed protein product [Meloidogyne enterolobii]
MLYINKSYATPHWSQGNSVTERSFRTFHNIISKYISKDQPDFDELIDYASFCYNTSIHSSTGETPFFLMFGRDPIFCIDQILDPSINSMATNDISEFKQKLVTSLRKAWEIAADENKKAQLKSKEQYDKLLRNPTITVGDRVLLRNYAGRVETSKKFHIPLKEIFRAIKIESSHLTITSCNSPNAPTRIVHINQLKKCFEELTPACTSPNLLDEEIESLNKAENERKEKEQVTSQGSENSEKVKEKDTREPSPNKNKLKTSPIRQKGYNLRANPKPRKLSID